MSSQLYKDKLQQFQLENAEIKNATMEAENTSVRIAQHYRTLLELLRLLGIQEILEAGDTSTPGTVAKLLGGVSIADVFKVSSDIGLTDPQDPPQQVLTRLANGDIKLKPIEEFAAGSGLATDMSNLDNDISNGDKHTIRGKLGAAYEGFDNQNTGGYSGSVGGLEIQNSGYGSGSVGGDTNQNPGNYSGSVGGVGLQNKTKAETSRGQFNLSESNHADSANVWHDDDLVESVGGGTDNNNRLNLFARYKNGAFYWIQKTLSTITNAVKGFHAADTDGRLNYFDGSVWKKYLLEGEGSGGGVTNIFNLNQLSNTGLQIFTERSSFLTNEKIEWNTTSGGEKFDFLKVFEPLEGTYTLSFIGSMNNARLYVDDGIKRVYIDMIDENPSAYSSKHVGTFTFFTDSNDVFEIGVESLDNTADIIVRNPMLVEGSEEMGYYPSLKEMMTNFRDYTPIEVTETNNNENIQFWKGTQAEYDAITTKDTQTLYIIN